MKTVAEYRKYADECRLLARQVGAGQAREQLLEMARTWDSLAETRKRLVGNRPELDTGKSLVTEQLPSEQ